MFAGFCVTVLGLWWLLVSYNQDREGFNRPWSYTFGAVTTHLVLSQTTIAFMRENLVGLKAGIIEAEQAISENHQGLLGHESLGHMASLVLLIETVAIWLLVTHLAPLIAVLRASQAYGYLGQYSD